MPQPRRRGATPARVYVTVSRSGEIASPKKRSSSPVLTTMVTAVGSADRMRPPRNFAAPPPPPRTVKRGPTRTRRALLAGFELLVERGAFDRPAADTFDETTDFLDRRVLAGI